MLGATDESSGTSDPVGSSTGIPADISGDATVGSTLMFEAYNLSLAKTDSDYGYLVYLPTNAFSAGEYSLTVLVSSGDSLYSIVEQNVSIPD
jgi:hypothetical protein